LSDELTLTVCFFLSIVCCFPLLFVYFGYGFAFSLAEIDNLAAFAANLVSDYFFFSSYSG
jgi:hypothetical protein